MKKLFLSLLFLTSFTLMNGQTVLTINGVITDTNGDGKEGIFVGVDINGGTGQSDFTETNTDGSYQFQLILSDDEGSMEVYFLDCNFETISVIENFDASNLDFTFDFNYCENGSSTCAVLLFPGFQDSTIIISALPFGVGPFTYEWSDGSTSETFTVPLNTTGIYCLTITDADGCLAEDCLDFGPPDPCSVSIFEESLINATLLYAEGFGQSNVFTYLWSTGETTETITVTESGEYCVTLTDEGGCTSSDCRFVEIDSISNLDCFAFIYLTIDADSVETLVAESFGVGYFTYSWTFGNGVISTSQSIFPESPGEYCVEITDSEGCVFTACYDYFIWEDCGVWILCDPIEEGVLLWASGYGEEPIVYVWEDGTIGQDLLVNEDGEYCVTITDASGCVSSGCINVTIEEPVECFTPIEVQQFEENAVLTINPVIEGTYEYFWSTAETGASITVEESGVYCVEVFEIETECYFNTCATINLEPNPECWGVIIPGILGDSTAILTITTNSIYPDEIEYSYLWSTGDTTSSIIITEDDIYCVTVVDSYGCEFSTCQFVSIWDIPWANAIFGYVYGNDFIGNIDGTVEIYRINDDETLELYAGEVQTTDGMFVVNGVEDGKYIALAYADAEGYVPTYGFSTSSWEEAFHHEVGTNSGFFPLSIEMIPIESVDGYGSIQGMVSTENIVADDKGDETRSSIPLEGANIMLMHNSAPVGQLFSNEEGNFSFTNLPFGAYEVVLEIPGFPRKVLNVVLTEENPNVWDIDFETEVVATSIENTSALSALTLSPNPTSHTLVVDFDYESNKEIKYRLTDIHGKIIKSSVIDIDSGENTLQLDVSSLKNGVYNIVLHTNEGLVAKRFIKL